ncbi:MAG: glutamine-hydrolyzing carbamoyl-phosphate synthase small subunit [Clostridia bacterium]|nr:glutamine-hydrolyzing carbamoyl-phosphate synthase small subunit [Clostridia bacterium]
MQRKIILEDGTSYVGTSFGSESDKKLELVFNTSMVGYQEIISDPSYTDQAVVMTYPIIGNYGINSDDFETVTPSIGALIVKDYVDEPSNFRSEESLSECMAKYDIAGVSGIDTRSLTRKIREIGSCKVLITNDTVSDEEGKKILEAWDYAHDQVKRVSTQAEVNYGEKNKDKGPKIVVVDCGVKMNIIRSLVEMGCYVVRVPHNTTSKRIEEINPDGILLSNGPGNPEDNEETISTVKALHGKFPIMGICLGHQILALSYGAKTYKLKFGHRGGNHPVKNLDTDKLEITSQNHSYAVDTESATKAGLEITHINILDNTVEGLKCTKDKAFSVQYHPESAPGPQDSKYLFESFIKMVEEK